MLKDYSNLPPMPGIFLKKIIKEVYHSTTRDIALRLDTSVAHLSKIINGEQKISPRIALRIEKLLGISADELLKKQAEWDLAHARIRYSEELENIKPYTTKEKK